ncbi:hypothetical protein BCR34DRAFT_582556 [Clohesyomyces aquaticus]|uniref:Cora-like Mg2+ transporter protein-domain-containing protein n=1 Tax=Clohesyomyces aquaticus TaxID=1231657 RepID=A0A1Y2A8Y3_9PLEO|nr:hypothetical protein BCR34DRAFT_582556 [Clohesyomyces aquaticus]
MNNIEQRVEEARSDLPKVETAKPKYTCFFKVIDVSTSGKGIEDRGQCFRNLELESFYNTVPPQPEDTIRIILDGRHRRIRPRDTRNTNPNAYPKCNSLLGSNHLYHTPAPNPLYTSPAVIADSFRYYHLPTLRKLAWLEGESRWYGVHCFAAHIDDCPSLSGNLSLLRSTSERSYAYLTVCKNDRDLLTIICYAPDAFATPPDLRRHDYLCANANWRFLKELDVYFSKPTSHLGIGNVSEKQTLQVLLLNIAFVNLEQTANFLDYISSHMDEEDWKILPRDFFPLRETRVVDMLGERIVVLRTVEDVMLQINGAIECLSRSISLLYQDEARQTSPAVLNYLDSLQQDSDYYQIWAKQLKSKSMEIHEVTVSRFNVKQASSVSQLTLLAAFFLPLSLAAGVLSMQTRFIDLNLLLYDFVGVVVILATIALLVGTVNRYGLDFIKLMVRGQEGRRGGFGGPGPRPLRVLMLSLWWMAILSSFLVGMIKDVVYGLKIFGLEAAGIVVTGWVSYGLSEWMVLRKGRR